MGEDGKPAGRLQTAAKLIGGTTAVIVAVAGLIAALNEIGLLPVYPPERVPNAPPIALGDNYQIWEEQTLGIRLRPGESRTLSAQDLYRRPATFPAFECYGEGFVVYTWQVRVPRSNADDLVIRRQLMGGRTEQVGRGPSGHTIMDNCRDDTMVNEGLEELEIQIRYSSAART
jgi:hypothetical protein